MSDRATELDREADALIRRATELKVIAAKMRLDYNPPNCDCLDGGHRSDNGAFCLCGGYLGPRT